MTTNIINLRFNYCLLYFVKIKQTVTFKRIPNGNTTKPRLFNILTLTIFKNRPVYDGIAFCKSRAHAREHPPRCRCWSTLVEEAERRISWRVGIARSRRCEERVIRGDFSRPDCTLRPRVWERHQGVSSLSPISATTNSNFGGGERAAYNVTSGRGNLTRNHRSLNYLCR